MQRLTFLWKCGLQIACVLAVLVASFLGANAVARLLIGDRLQPIERTPRVLAKLTARPLPPPPDVEFVFPGEIRIGDFVTNRRVPQGCLMHFGSYAHNLEDNSQGEKNSASNTFEGPQNATYLDLRYFAQTSHVGHFFNVSTDRINAAWPQVKPTHLAMLARTTQDGTTSQFRWEAKQRTGVSLRHIVALEDQPLSDEWQWLLMPLWGFHDDSADWYQRLPNLAELVVVYEAGYLTQPRGTLQIARLGFVNREQWQPTLPESLAAGDTAQVVVRETRPDSVQRSMPKAPRNRSASATASPAAGKARQWELFDFTSSTPRGRYGTGFGSWQEDAGAATSSTDEIAGAPATRLLLRYRTVGDLDVGHYFDLNMPLLNDRLSATDHPAGLKIRLRPIELPSRFRIEFKSGDLTYGCDIDLDVEQPALQADGWSDVTIPLERFGLNWQSLAGLTQLVFVYDGQRLDKLSGSFEVHSISLVR